MTQSPSRDPRVDAYIGNAAPFAQPVLTHLRDIVHAACPDVVESVKWGMPFFTWHGNLCHMAAFKQHCAFGLWLGRQVLDEADSKASEAMGQFGRIAALSDLPSKKILIGHIKRAMDVNASGAKPVRAKAAPKKALPVPDDLADALENTAEARANFDRFPPGGRRDYIEWISEAKRDETRKRRVATAIEWIAEGRLRNWKYMNC